MTGAQDAAALYMRGLTFPRVGRALDITEGQAIDATMAVLDMVHCPNCGLLIPRAQGLCEECRQETRGNDDECDALPFDDPPLDDATAAD